MSAAEHGPLRVAEVHGADADRVAAYLPSNYRILGIADEVVLIAGVDRLGWTLDGYVIPRLASGMIRAVEVTS